MKANPFNICPSCIHRETCVLTDQKSQVWSCSDYGEVATEVTSQPVPTIKIHENRQTEIVMA
ncbi:hypothetical protein BXY75_2114 [Ulvibacter antarcticus]|uniref:Uncharacterized protein n=1 Tax=Ulvibacter antarcticus TaxID=442714 RepID=A0A3L9YGQ7_9FLAO|nr:hypothetical protein BXY75_2114 [Ulvibacter antarcticus]